MYIICLNVNMLQLGLVEKEAIKADLKWVFEKSSGGGVYNSYQHLSRKRDLVLIMINQQMHNTDVSQIRRSYQTPFEVQFLDLLLVLR